MMPYHFWFLRRIFQSSSPFKPIKKMDAKSVDPGPLFVGVLNLHVQKKLHDCLSIVASFGEFFFQISNHSFFVYPLWQDFTIILLMFFFFICPANVPVWTGTSFPTTPNFIKIKIELHTLLYVWYMGILN